VNVKYDGIVSFLRLYTHGWSVCGSCAKNKSQLDIYGPYQGSWVWGDELGPKISHPLPHPPWSQKEREKKARKKRVKF
jgi:hypothetical protein